MKFLSVSSLLSMTMTSSILLSSLIIRSISAQSYPQVAQRTFVDDAGITHTTRKANPEIICSARTALSFYHQFGLDGSQISGTYGAYFPRGSIGDMRDPDYKPYWPVDPTEDELAFLKSIPNFSPTCFHAKNTKCDEIDVDRVINNAPDKWVYIGNGNWHTGERMKQITTAVGNYPIFISTHYDGNKNPGCITYNPDTATYTTDTSKCKARSLIDVIKRTNELANFLGIAKVDIARDQQKMCEAAMELTTAAANAHQKGIRVMTVNPSINDNNAVTLYPVDPLSDPYLRTYEELGVPILHPGKHPSSKISEEKIPSKEWFANCQQGQTLNDCNENTYYPVDLWLIEGRRFFFNTPEEQYFLNKFFPDKALLKNQVAHWPMNDGPISYTTAARSFAEMTRKLNDAVRLHDSTICTTANVTSEAFLDSRFGGLTGGQYACYDEPSLQLDYLECNAVDLAGGNQMMTTLGKVAEEKFTPMISKPVMAPTVMKQTKKSMWIKNEMKESISISIGAIVWVVVIAILVSVIIFAGVIFYFCWKKSTDTASTAREKSQIESVSTEEGSRTSITENELPVMT